MEFLLELYTEEMPYLHIKSAFIQISAKLKEFLEEEKIEFQKIKLYGTGCRIIVFTDLASHQTDKEEKIIGPPKSVAINEGGNPGPAARGFAKSQGIDVDKLQIIKMAKGEYVGVSKVIKGKPTQEILEKGLPLILTSISFPKMMKWGSYSLRFSRPIKNLLCVFDGQPVSFSINGISSANYTWGHKIHSNNRIQVVSFDQYKKDLRSHYVIIDPDERRKNIQYQMNRRLSDMKASLLEDDDLMEKHSLEVQYPYVFMGEFPEEYLKLPLEVLSTAMKEGQHLFSVVKDGKQLPYFFGVADTYKDDKGLIQKGNERVLRARLEDARFFWQQDQMITLKERAKKLDAITFQENLGTYDDKTQRLKKICSYLADKLDEKKEKKRIVEAAELSKADLLTEMVREFPSLQGKIGGLYARNEGASASVWKAIYEHYEPQNLESSPPSQISGSILSIADKLDSIIGVTGSGIKVTGSKDPFGLRRNALGICKIILEKKINLSFSRLLDKTISVYGDMLKESKGYIKEYCLDFFKSRLQFIYENQGYRYDLVSAVLSQGVDNIFFSFSKLKALDGMRNSPQFEPLVLIAKRVNNILRDQPKYRINEELFVEKEERDLYTTFTIIRNNAQPFIAKGNFQNAQKIILRMRSSINAFFDNVLVMTEEKKLRRNRLALLQAISKLLSQIADYSQIVLDG